MKNLGLILIDLTHINKKLRYVRHYSKITKEEDAISWTK